MKANTTSRRSLLLGFASGMAARARAAGAAFVDFVHVTDPHVINPAGVHPRLLEMRSMFTHTRAALPRDLALFRRELKVEFAVITGDLVDVYSFQGADGSVATGQVEAFAAIMAASNLPVYPALGNHDVQHYGLGQNNRLAPDQSNVEQAKAAWIRKVGAFEEGTYYAFHRDVGDTRWRFIMLNNGFYGHLPGPARRPPEYGLGRGQADWLTAECRRHPDAPLVLGLHIPPKDAALAEIEKALGERRKVTLLLTGHIHESDFIQELPFAKARAFQVATPAYATGPEHYRRVRLYPGRVEVAATGKSGAAVKSIAIEP